MSIIRTRNVIPLILALILMAVAATAVAAQDAAPQPPSSSMGRPHGQAAPIRDANGLWMMPAGAEVERTPQTAPASTGGPDDFGYTWDDSVPLNWIDASGGIETGINSNVDHVGPISIGFPFKYYENTRSQLYISRFGFVSFNDTGIYNSQSQVPATEKPDDVIAPHWVPAYNVNGYVRYRKGGTAPNRWFVVEWNRLSSDCCSGDTPEEYTFEAVLHESGDIVFQYGDMIWNGNWWCQASGIEDSSGLDGLAVTPYCRQVPGHHATRITRPAPAARVNLFPLQQGMFVHNQEIASFEITIRNTGELGTDIYDLFPNSGWPLALFRADGVTPVSDSDGDGIPDSGSIPQGGSRTIVARVTTPGSASVGNSNTASITVRSSLNTGKQKQVDLRTAVPSTFVQTYSDAGNGVDLLLARPEARRETSATGAPYWGYNLAVAEQPGGNLIQSWTVGRCSDNNCATYVTEIYTAILDPYGEIVRPPTRLFDLSGTTYTTYDYPAIAVAPNGRIGMLWERYLWDSSTSRYNYNIYFAVLNPTGDLIHGPTNVTQNNVWGSSNDLNVPYMYYPRITATADNNFVLAWYQGHGEDQGYVYDIWYSVRQSNGVMVKAATNLTHDGPDYSDGYSYPTLAATEGNRALLAFSRYGSYGDIYFVVLDSHGNVVRSIDNLSGGGAYASDYRPDAVELSDGRILVAWSGSYYPQYTIRFAILDAAFNRIAGPTSLINSIALTGNDYVSVSADSAGRAILTWMDRDHYNRRNLYYALVRSDGNILTPATIFRSSQSSAPNLFSSFEGDGNASYSWTPPAGVDNQLIVGSSTVSGALNGGAVLNIKYRGRGGQTATGVTLTATLDPRLAYHSDTSGVTPTVNGNTVTWALPDVRLFDRREFRVLLRVAGAAIGDLLPVQLTLTATQPDLHPGDNSASIQVRVDRPFFLPMVLRRP